MKSILSLKLQEKRLKVVENFSLESGKTKDLVKILANLVEEERTVFILKDDDSMIRRAGRNIPWIRFFSYNRLRAHDLFYGKKILIMEGAVEGLNNFYGLKA